MRIAIAGATGFVGSRLSRTLAGEGHEIVPISRHAVPGGVRWDPVAGLIDANALEGLDAVLNLAGENLAGYWTAGKKRRIVDSRVRGTRLLSDTLAGLVRRPATLISWSAVGHYGAREGDEPVDESAPAGSTFLAQVTTAWEGATAAAAAAGIRVVHPRMGMVVGRGGAIAVMLPLFQMGLGGSIGSGRQMVSWIALDEIAPALQHILRTPSLAGPVNFTAPGAVRFDEFARELAGVLGRPALFRVPTFAARLALGEMGKEVVLSGARVVPRKLLDSGYQFRYPELRMAMKHELGTAG